MLLNTYLEIDDALNIWILQSMTIKYFKRKERGWERVCVHKKIKKYLKVKFKVAIFKLMSDLHVKFSNNNIIILREFSFNS